MLWFSTRSTIGIDVSDHVIRAVRVVRKRKQYIVKHFAAVQVEQGAIVNGEIRDEAKVRKDVHRLLSDGFTPQASTIVIGLPEAHGFLKTVTAPVGGLDDEIQKHLPFPVSEVILDTISHGMVDMDGVTRELASFAAIKTPIAVAYQTAFNGFGLHIRALEIESQAIARLFIPEQEDAGQVTILIDIGKNHTTFVAAEQGHIDLTHTVSALNAEKTDGLNAEVEKVIRFHREHSALNTQKQYQILLTGGGSKKSQLREQMETELHTPVRQATLPPCIQVPDGLKMEYVSYGTAIGLAIRTFHPL